MHIVILITITFEFGPNLTLVIQLKNKHILYLNIPNSLIADFNFIFNLFQKLNCLFLIAHMCNNYFDHLH